MLKDLGDEEVKDSLSSTQVVLGGRRHTHTHTHTSTRWPSALRHPWRHDRLVLATQMTPASVHAKACDSRLVPSLLAASSGVARGATRQDGCRPGVGSPSHATATTDLYTTVQASAASCRRPLAELGTARRPALVACAVSQAGDGRRRRRLPIRQAHPPVWTEPRSQTGAHTSRRI